MEWEKSSPFLILLTCLIIDSSHIYSNWASPVAQCKESTCNAGDLGLTPTEHLIHAKHSAKHQWCNSVTGNGRTGVTHINVKRYIFLNFRNPPCTFLFMQRCIVIQFNGVTFCPLKWPFGYMNEWTRTTSISALLTMPKPLTVWITINCAKFWKRWEY